MAKKNEIVNLFGIYNNEALVSVLIEKILYYQKRMDIAKLNLIVAILMDEKFVYSDNFVLFLKNNARTILCLRSFYEALLPVYINSLTFLLEACDVSIEGTNVEINSRLQPSDFEKSKRLNAMIENIPILLALVNDKKKEELYKIFDIKL